MTEGSGAGEPRGPVFISHHNSKRATAFHLSDYFARHGIASWVAPRDIPPGSDWDQAIAGAIENASALVLLFCAEADQSRHVKREINLADKAGVPIYWVRIEAVEPDKLGYFLSSSQWVDWLDNRDSTLDTLVGDLSAGPRVRLPAPGTPVGAVPASPRTESEQVVPGSWPRGIYAFDSDRDAGEAAARVYFAIARKEPDSTLVLPTGRAATQVFRAMLRLAGNEPPFGDAHLMNDTETFGVWARHDSSRTRHVLEMLIEPLRKKGLAPEPENLHLLSGIFAEEDPVLAAQRALRVFPPSLHAVSVSPNGEILGFEVGTYDDADVVAESGVGVIQLSELGRGYIDPNQPSRSVLSVGIGTALEAPTLLVLAFAGNKANVMRRMVGAKETAGVPATLLGRHHNAHLITTRAVAEEAGLLPFAITVSPAEAADRIVSRP